MAKYVLDSNIYISATRDDAWNDALESFMWSWTPSIYLHSVVAGELLTGAVSAELERKTYSEFIAPLEDTNRVITPTHGAWKRAGLIIAKLIRTKRLAAGAVPRSFFSDCLIAASARDNGC
ncbi:MAG TPA: type II toxin-antitoxin system VapC family toxin, partial [Longimicrobium sp.]|nr:type II toxin-antitoxin system VapC family toxin [Longimicrobium sp.]